MSEETKQPAPAAAADQEPPVVLSPMARLERLEEKVFGAPSEWSFPTKKKKDDKAPDEKAPAAAPPPATTPAGLGHPSEKADQGATGQHKR